KEWPARARRALVELCAGKADDDTLGVQLLRDCRTVFKARAVDRLSSEDLLVGLIKIEESPWAEINNGKPLTKNGLARKLKPYGITSGTIRLEDGTTPKGYYRASFKDAWNRYVHESPMPPDAFQNATTPQGNTDAGSLDLSKRHTE